MPSTNKFNCIFYSFHFFYSFLCGSLHLYYGFQFCDFMGFLWVSLYLEVFLNLLLFCMFACIPSVWCSFSLFFFILFYCLLFYRCLFLSKKKEKERLWDWWRGSWRRMGRQNQNVLYEKNIFKQK